MPLTGDETVVLLDAFALGALANDQDVCRPLEGRLLLTPNGAETEILLGHDAGDETDDLPELADRYRAVVCGSGYVAEPGGRLRHMRPATRAWPPWAAATCSPARSQGSSPAASSSATPARWATWLHATAGDRLAERIGPVGFLARELADELPRLLAEQG